MTNLNLKLMNPRTGLMAGFLILLQACISAPQTNQLLLQSGSLPIVHEIQNVPFYPQEDFFCGPTTLAEVLHFYELGIDPEQIAPNLFIPGRQGSLQIEMVASVRQYGMLAYAAQGNLKQLLSLVSEDIPVIVLQNQGLSWYPMWHYALVIGYDLEAETVILHTGVNERRFVSMNLFESTWSKGDYWLLAALPPDNPSSHFDPFLYVSAAQDLMVVDQQPASITALESATRQWPDYWLSYFLLGNHFLQNSPLDSLTWFRKGYNAGRSTPSYLNNYAYALYYNGCLPEALDMIQRAIILQPDDSTLQDSLLEIRQSQSKQITNSIVQNPSCSI